jgi:hypothetical protein
VAAGLIRGRGLCEELTSRHRIIQNEKSIHTKPRFIVGGIPACEELRCCDEVLLAVVNGQWLRTAAGVSPILASPLQKAFAVWHVEGHYFCLTGISSGSNRAVRTFLGLADYRFGFKVLLQPEDPAFPTDPRLFEPTEPASLK